MNPHAQQAQLHVGPAIESSPVVTILLHGRNQTPEFMLAIAERLAIADMPYLALSAKNNTWYPKSFLEPLVDNSADVDLSIEHIESVVRTLEAGGKTRDRIAIVGFSQGACIGSEYVFRFGGQWGALSLLTGGVIGPPGTVTTEGGASLAGTTVFFGNSDADELVPLWRTRETFDAFVRLGAAAHLEVFPGRDHRVGDAEIVRTRALLLELQAKFANRR